MRIAYSPRALRDIEEILTYTHQRSPRGAQNVSLAIEYAVLMCALHPRAAARTDEPDVRRRPLGKYRYTIFYRALALDQGIEVVRVVRSARVRNLSKVPEAEDEA